MPTARCARPSPRHSAGTAALLLALLFAARAQAGERVVLVPDSPPSWRLSRLIAPLRSAAERAPRELEVDTSPEMAELELFYTRSGAQARSARARAPLTVVLPALVDVAPGDHVEIRARAPGYRTQEVGFAAGEPKERLNLTLQRLPNEIVGAAWVELVGRARLTLFTSAPLAARGETASGGWNLIVSDAALSPAGAAALSEVSGEIVSGISVRTLGEDLAIRLSSNSREAYELRTSQSREAVRPIHRFALDFVPPDAGAASLAAAEAALAQLSASEFTGCAAEFDRALRDALDPAALARALAPSGAFTDAVIARAMRRLGDLSRDGRVHSRDGSSFVPARPLELASALAQPGEALGFLALLRSFGARLEPGSSRPRVLKALIAPELPSDELDAALALAEGVERRCAAGR